MAEPAPPRASARLWPWLLVLLLALAAGALLAWRPWSPPAGAEAADPAAASPSAAEPTTAHAPDRASAAGPGPVFDEDGAAALFFTDAELAQAVPLAAGLALADVEEPMWGLPDGSAVTPPSCTPAVTIVERQPDAFLRRFAGGDAVTVVQSVDVLADAGTAAAAFDLLVRTLGACDDYRQMNPGVDSGSWVAGPPTTDHGAVPTVVRRLTLTAEGATGPEVEVTALTGNALVTTTVSGVDPETDPADPGVLARVARAAGERALAASG
jgi:hypothetical protein